MRARGGDGLKAAIISGLGSGYAPFASGSWGSLFAAVLFAIVWLTVDALGGGRWLVEALTGLGIALSCVLSVVWGDWAIRRYRRSDPKQFTLDEFAGQWVALLALPLALGGDLVTFGVIVFGQFFLFRLFDVLKVPPARQLEYLPGGWGVLCDDLAAGLYALGVGQLLWRLTPAASWLGLTDVLTTAS